MVHHFSQTLESTGSLVEPWPDTITEKQALDIAVAPEPGKFKTFNFFMMSVLSN